MSEKPLYKMKREKPKKEQDPHFITTHWWDLKKTADELGVEVSTVVRAKELTKTNRRDVVINHIKTWTVPNSQIELPPVGNEQKSLEQIKKEAEYTRAINNAKQGYKGEPYSWPMEVRLQILYAAVQAGIKIDLEYDGWIVPKYKQEEVLKERNEIKVDFLKSTYPLTPNMTLEESKGSNLDIDKEIEDLDAEVIKRELLTKGHVDGVTFPKEKRELREDIEIYVQTKEGDKNVKDFKSKEEFGKAVSEAEYVRSVEVLSKKEALKRYGVQPSAYTCTSVTSLSKEDIEELKETIEFKEDNKTPYKKEDLEYTVDGGNTWRNCADPTDVYKRFVYQVIEIQEGWLSKLLRRPNVFRLEIFAKGESIEVVPQWIHANMGMQGYNKCKVELVGTVNKVK